MKEKIIRLLEEKKLGELREELQRINPADLAILLEDLDEKERLLVYRCCQRNWRRIRFLLWTAICRRADQWLYGP